VPQTRSHHRIDPFEVVSAGDCHAARALGFEAEPVHVDRKRARETQRDVDVFVPIAGAAQQVQGGKAARRAVPACNFIGDARLENGLLIVELDLAVDIEAAERAAIQLEAAGETEIGPDDVGEESEAALTFAGCPRAVTVPLRLIIQA